jgi:hypothetical protein
MTSLIKTRAGSIELGKIHPEDDALELMYFGSRGMTRRADEYLATLGLANCVLWMGRTFRRMDWSDCSVLSNSRKMTDQSAAFRRLAAIISQRRRS